MFQLARAESMDRYQNLLCIHQTMQDDRKVQGDSLDLSAARDAQSHQDFHSRTTTVTTEAQAWTQSSQSRLLIYVPQRRR